MPIIESQRTIYSHRTFNAGHRRWLKELGLTFGTVVAWRAHPVTPQD